jgi:hypothetical protein
MKLLQCAIALILLTFLFAGCLTDNASTVAKDASATEPAISVAFPAAQNIDDVAQAAQLAAQGREWSIQKVENNRLYASLRHRRYDSQIQIAYSENGFEIYSNSWYLSRSGEKLRFEHPESWLHNLEQDIMRSLLITK